MAAKTTADDTRGKVMYLIIFNGDAPSTRADSNTSVGSA